MMMVRRGEGVRSVKKRRRDRTTPATISIKTTSTSATCSSPQTPAKLLVSHEFVVLGLSPFIRHRLFVHNAKQAAASVYPGQGMLFAGVGSLQYLHEKAVQANWAFCCVWKKKKRKSTLLWVWYG